MKCSTIVEALPNGLYRHVCPECGFSDDTITTPAIVRYCGTPPARRAPPPPPPPSVGTELMALIAELGLTKPDGCQCAKRARQMDQWGIAGCKEHRAEIVGWLRETFKAVSWTETLRAASAMMRTDWFSVLDPFGSLVDESIRRAEAKQSAP